MTCQYLIRKVLPPLFQSKQSCKHIYLPEGELSAGLADGEAGFDTDASVGAGDGVFFTDFSILSVFTDLVLVATSGSFIVREVTAKSKTAGIITADTPTTDKINLVLLFIFSMLSIILLILLR